MYVKGKRKFQSNNLAFSIALVAPPIRVHFSRCMFGNTPRNLTLWAYDAQCAKKTVFRWRVKEARIRMICSEGKDNYGMTLTLKNPLYCNTAGCRVTQDTRAKICENMRSDAICIADSLCQVNIRWMTFAESGSAYEENHRAKKDSNSMHVGLHLVKVSNLGLSQSNRSPPAGTASFVTSTYSRTGNVYWPWRARELLRTF